MGGGWKHYEPKRLPNTDSRDTVCKTWYQKWRKVRKAPKKWLRKLLVTHTSHINFYKFLYKILISFDWAVTDWRSYKLHFSLFLLHYRSINTFSKTGMRLAQRKIGYNAQKLPAIVTFVRLFQSSKDPYPHAGKHFLTLFTLISEMTKFRSELAKINQLAAQSHPLKKIEKVGVIPKRDGRAPILLLVKAIRDLFTWRSRLP